MISTFLNDYKISQAMDMWIFIGISFPTTQAMKMWIFIGISFRKKIRFIWNSEGHRYLWTLLNYLQKKKKK